MGIARSALQIAMIVIALVVFGVVGAKFAGQRAEQATLERMGTVWPEFSAMTEADRIFLIHLSLACELVRRPAERAEVVACLRSGAQRAGGQAPARLQRLLPPDAPG